MFSRFLAGNVPMSTRWAKNSPGRIRAGRARRDNIVATIINSLTQADFLSLLLEPKGLDGEPLDFRTSKRNQYVIDVFGKPFRVSKANGQPVYRLSAMDCDLTLFASP